MGITVQIKKKLGNFELDVTFQGRSRRIGILGASGCGKSMTLKSIAGIETPDVGVIRIGNRTCFDSARKLNVRPQKRNIGYLFQNYALFPTMTVAENIGAGLTGRRKDKQARVQKMIEKFQLSGLEAYLPGQLSGGQQQRTALARIMAYEPDVILLDEPFSALDVFLKDRLQQELQEMLAEYEGTIIMVSHSYDEIYRFSDELLVMDRGKAAIYGKTKDLFANPVQKEAARLTGCKNFSDILRVDEHTIEALDWGLTLRTEKKIPEHATCVGYRAHDFVPIWGARKKNCLKVQIENIAELPFEKNFYLLPENAKKRKEETRPTICWSAQREVLAMLKEKGWPDYLEILEENIMFLN